MREFQKPVYTRALLAYSQALQSVFKTVAGDGATPNNDDALHHVQQPSRGTVKVSELQSTVGLLLSVVAEAQMSPVAESVLRAASCALLDTFSAGNSHVRCFVQVPCLCRAERVSYPSYPALFVRFCRCFSAHPAQKVHKAGSTETYWQLSLASQVSNLVSVRKERRG